MKQKLIAIASDGFTDGDSIFNIHDLKVDYFKDMTIENVKEKISNVSKLIETGFDEEMINDIIIAYVVNDNTYLNIVNERTKELEKEIENREFVRDVDDYDLNELEREILIDIAIKTIS